MRSLVDCVVRWKKKVEFMIAYLHCASDSTNLSFVCICRGRNVTEWRPSYLADRTAGHWVLFKSREEFFLFFHFTSLIRHAMPLTEANKFLRRKIKWPSEGLDRASSAYRWVRDIRRVKAPPGNLHFLIEKKKKLDLWVSLLLEGPVMNCIFQQKLITERRN